MLLSRFWRFLLLLGILVFLCPNCSNEPTTATGSPEEVARQWQRYIDSNEFEKAKAISTDRAKELIDMIASILFEDAEELELPPTQFLKMNCTEWGDSATCVYQIDADGEVVIDSFRLLKIKNRWLVDMAEEEPMLEEDEVEELFNDLDDLLENAMKADSI